MKACVFQKQEPVNIPQIETGVLTDVLAPAVGLRDLRPAHALEPAQRPAARTRCRTTARTCSSSASGPAGYTLAHHLAQRGLRRRRHRRPQDRAAPRRARPATTGRPPRADQATVARSTDELDERILARLRRRLRVRHHRPLGQELPHAALPHARAPQAASDVRRRPLRRHARRSTTPGSSASITSRSPPGAGRPTIIDDEEQPHPRHPQGERLPDGAAAHRRLQAGRRSRTCRCACPRSSSAAASPPSTRRPSCSPTTRAGREDARAVRDARRREGRGRRCWRDVRRGGAASPRRVPRRTARAVRAERERAAREGRRAGLPAARRSWGGVSLVYRKRVLDSPAYRLNHEEVIKASRRACASSRTSRPMEAVLDARGHVKAMKFERQLETASRWRDVELPARTCASPPARARTSPTRRSTRDVRARQEEAVLPAARGRVDDDGDARGSSRRRAQEGFFTSYDDGTARVHLFYGDNHPHYAGSVVKAMAARRTAIRTSWRSSATTSQLRSPTSRKPRATRAGCALVGALDDELVATVVHEVERLTPTIVEVVVRAPAAARKFQPGPVLPPPELRDARAARRRHAPHDGGHRAHRRLGRQGEGPARR